ncbi:extracellular solute-binding protein [Paenibacillus sp. IB182496]|uniref:Extracellular solute-binding protein n=1 Tax=Paenibacillus sabuli TaxID=2772509 RepID=A0A927BPK7_9BACL|nr:extracellular solute-binding protein [Paenibacillus sabuli]MBD2844393.1 extracellular solute-binding protein [Paenibacillus sabuli]
MLKRKTVRTLLFVVLIGAMLMAAACTKQDASPSSSDTDNVQPEPADEEALREAVTFPLEKPITLTAFANRHADAKAYNEMAFFKNVEEKTNIRIEWDLAVQASLVERRNLLLSSNDLPDIFYGASILQNDDMLRMINQGQLIPIDDMIELYAPNFNKILKQRPDIRKVITAADGHIYTIPHIYESMVNTAPDAMFINKEWLDALGLAVPETTEELYNVLRAFKTQDPNGNGKADELPMSFRYQNAKNQSAIQSAASLSGSFGPIDQQQHKHIAIEDGKLVFVPMTEGYKTYANYMRTLYQEGLIDPEVFTQDNQVYNAKIEAEESLIGVWFGWNVTGRFGSVEQSPYIPVAPLKGPAGRQEWNRVEPRVAIGSFAITRANSHPEASLAWMDQMLTEESSMEAFWGPFGINLVRNEDGTIDFAPKPEGMTNPQFRHSDAPGTNAVPILLSDMLEKVVPNPAEAEKFELLELYRPYQSKEILPGMLLSNEESETLALIESDIVNYVEDKLAQWIFNGNIEAEWNAYAEQLKQMNVEEYVTIYQQAYDRYTSQ